MNERINRRFAPSGKKEPVAIDWLEICALERRSINCWTESTSQQRSQLKQWHQRLTANNANRSFWLELDTPGLDTHH